MIDRVLQKTKRICNEFIFVYYPSLTKIVKEKKNMIIMYHGVTLDGSTDFNTRHISIKCFEKQILFFKKHCNVITVEDYFNEKFDLNKPNIAITFDDGYLNNYTYAKPILENYNMPATFYITGVNRTVDNILWADFVNIITRLNNDEFVLQSEKYIKKAGKFYNSHDETLDFVIKHKMPKYDFKMNMYSQLNHLAWFKKNNIYDEYWKLMSDEHIIDCSKSKYINIGSHGFYHDNLGNITIADAKNDLLSSKIYLENLIQKSVMSIAYPDGSYSRELIEVAFNMGFLYQLATDEYLFREDIQDKRINNRKGVYSCDSCGNQIIY